MKTHRLAGEMHRLIDLTTFKVRPTIRPIISAVGRPANESGCLLAKILFPLLQFISVHIGSVYDLLDRFKELLCQTLINNSQVAIYVEALSMIVDNAAVVRALQQNA